MLSKSKYLNGMQCLKYLWLLCNDPAKVPAFDAATQRIFDQGHLVGELAWRLYPDGIVIPVNDFKAGLNMTRRLLTDRKTLFEASVSSNGLYSRIDILKPAANNCWDIIEVKSSTSVKEENLHDVSFQKHCLEKFGLKIDKCLLVFINNQYVKNGEIDPGELFTIQDITEDAAAAGDGIENRIRTMMETIAAPECPDLPVSSGCSSPYACPVTVCRDELPENNILSLYRGGKKCYDLLYSGVLRLSEIPANYKLTAAQQIQKSCDISGNPHIDKEAVREFLSGIKPPVHFLDFETINAAVPLFDGTRPYQNIPFQFSLHITEDNNTRHFGYLAEGANDPRLRFLAELKSRIGHSGSIVIYNQKFEEGILRDLAVAFPEYAGWVEGVCGRMVDLLAPFPQFLVLSSGAERQCLPEERSARLSPEKAIKVCLLPKARQPARHSSISPGVICRTPKRPKPGQTWSSTAV